jgi:plasmid stability protein
MLSKAKAGATEMASLHVRNIEDDIVARLKERAAQNGRSAEAEHRAILREALDGESASAAARKAEWLVRADAFRKSLEGRHHTPSEVLLRESRDER